VARRALAVAPGAPLFQVFRFLYSTGRGEEPGGRSKVYTCTQMQWEWDPGKARLNMRKHGIAFADAVAALEDESALTMRDDSSDREERLVTLGLDAFGRLLVVVYTWRGERVRLISARKATARERRRYEENDEA